MFSNGTPPVYHFKILVPAAAAGRIIGKGGTTIAQLQKDAGARVKMSKASEFYPGTTERVCLISGPIEGILKINDFFMENFSSTSMKILVPNSTAGMIIGKGGSYIKQIKEDSGAYVQISQKCTDFSLPERCVTVVGELEDIRKACAMILNKIVEDVGSAFRNIRTSSITTSTLNSITTTTPATSINTHSSSSSSSASMFSTLATSNYCSSSSNNNNTTSPSSSSTTSSSSVSSTGSTILDHLNPSSRPAPILSPPKCSNNNNNHIITTNNNTSIIPFAQSISAASSSTTTANNNISTPPATSNLSAMSSSVTSDMNPAQIIETIRLVLRVSGYGEDAVSEISSAMSTLASYGVLGVGLGLL